MQNTTQSNYLDKTAHYKRVLSELKQVGVSRLGLRSHEAKYLPISIHADEHIMGAVFGHAPEGFVMLVATDKRVIYLDRKPLFSNQDEITYDVVSGVKYSKAAFDGTLTLHTGIKDYKLRNIHQESAMQFVRYIEQRCLEYSQQRRYPL